VVTLDYAPLAKGLTLFYALVDHDAPEPRVRRLIWTVEEAGEASGARVARVSLRWDERPKILAEVRASAEGVWTDGALDLKLPPVENDEWRAEGDAHPLRRVLSLGSTGRGLERDYHGCLEVGLTNEDTDSGRRWYAPGVGLVREDWTGESRNSTLALIRFSAPRP
jgi:hypothetical protein